MIRKDHLVLLILLFFAAACGQRFETLPLGDRPGRLFEPEGSVRGTIVAVHGFNDHSRAFDDFGAFAASQGYLVDAFDQQGFGRNANWGRWPGGDALVDDLILRLRSHRKNAPGRPLYLLGESMGAAVSILALAREPGLADGVILSAPAVWGGRALNPVYKAVLWTASRIAPGWLATGSGLGVSPSDNIEMLRALSRDALFVRYTRLQSVQGLVELMGEAREAGPRLVVPRLLLDGLRDEIVPPAAFDSFAPLIAGEHCRRITYADGWHMLLRDLQRRRVWEDILQWLNDPAGSDLGRACWDAGQS